MAQPPLGVGKGRTEALADGVFAIAMTLYTVALGTAFLSTSLSLAICAVVPFLYILPGRVDTLWKTGR
jgi:uncharacterized membrane protein